MRIDKMEKIEALDSEQMPDASLEVVYATPDRDLFGLELIGTICVSEETYKSICSDIAGPTEENGGVTVSLYAEKHFDS